MSNRYREKTGLSMDTREIFRLAQQQEDPIAKQIVGRQIDALSVGLANIICRCSLLKLSLAAVWRTRGNTFLISCKKGFGA